MSPSNRDAYIIEIQSSLSALWAETKECKMLAAQVEQKSEDKAERCLREIYSVEQRIKQELNSQAQMISQVAVSQTNHTSTAVTTTSNYLTAVDDLRRDVDALHGKLAGVQDDLRRDVDAVHGKLA